MTPLEAYGRFMKELTEVSVSQQVQEGMMLFAMVVAYRAFIGVGQQQNGSLVADFSSQTAEPMPQDFSSQNDPQPAPQENIIRPEMPDNGGFKPMTVQQAAARLSKDLPEVISHTSPNGKSVDMRRRITEDHAMGLVMVEYFAEQNNDPIRIVIDPASDPINTEAIIQTVKDAAKSRIMVASRENETRFISPIPAAAPTGAVTDEAI